MCDGNMYNNIRTDKELDDIFKYLGIDKTHHIGLNEL